MVWEGNLVDDKKFIQAIDTVSSNCISARLRMLNRVVTNLYDEALRPLGMKASQFNVMVVTAKLVLAQPKKVCEILQMDTSTLSRNVERMRAKGWLEVLSGEDARKQPFRLTALGENLLKKAVVAWQEAQKKAQELLGQDGVSLLTKMAGKFGMP
jgi:DNA-binding MarR family transcriptional regulator